MSWSLLVGVVLVLGFALCLAFARRSELQRMASSVQDRDRATRQGSAQAQLQHPVIDLSRCLGCGKCVKVCPEDGVLEMVHGQAMVVNGTRCVGIAACERECPVGAITVTLSNLETRKDIPAITPGLEAIGSPGLFLAGEVTAHALIKVAVDQGREVAAEVARRAKQTPSTNGTLDLLVIGAGPAGLSCSLEAKRNGLKYLTLDHEEELGGTVAKYPRRKLVLTQPIDMPLHGRLKSTSFTKEELMGLWRSIARQHQLQIRSGTLFTGLERQKDGTFVVHTDGGDHHARNVCLAVGRRGVPRKLGIPGEDLPKVAYSLMDAQSYRGRRILVVGGGDAAVETAVGLSEQQGNRVTLSYRKEAFFRIRSKSEQKLNAAVKANRLAVLMQSQPVEIRQDAVVMELYRNGQVEQGLLPNDEVFVMAGGVPPFELMQKSGVSFDHKLRKPSARIVEQGTGLIRALLAGLVMALITLAFALWHRDYYGLDLPDRPTHPKHALLRPGRSVGLMLGIASSALIVVNLLYLLRRSTKIKFNFGSLKAWMTSHVATGILALLCAMLHGAMTPRDTVGGHAFWALAVLLVTGAVGRYFYSYVPRAANGRELELAEVKAKLGKMADAWDSQTRSYPERLRAEVTALIEKRQWKSSFFKRVAALFWAERDLRHVLARIAREGKKAGVPEHELKETLLLTRRGHHAALTAAHFEDLRAILSTWRYLHRWVAAGLVLLVAVHVYHALRYGALL